MKHNHETLINNLTKETEILESLEWDYEKLDELYALLDTHFEGDSIISPALLLEEVSKKFSEECASVLRQLFIEVSLKNGLFISDPNVEN